MFDKRFTHGLQEFVNFIEKDKDSRIFRKNFPVFNNNYQSYLFMIVISSISNFGRRKRGFSIFDVYLKLNYFYYLLSNRINIENVDDFEIVF